MLFETHAHLSDSQFDADRDAVVARAIEAGIETIIEIADEPSEWDKARLLAEANPDHIWWAAGLHPYYSDQSSPDVWARLKNHSKHSRFVAIGEVGLDYAKCPIPPDVQIDAFKTALQLACEVKKPLIIHCRDAYDDLMPILRNTTFFDDSPGVIHCFSGNASHAEELIQMGFYLGVDGPLTYPNAHGLRLALEKVPLERIVLETDSPYLPPQKYRGQRNEPAHLVHIAQKLADLRGQSINDVGNLVTKNGHDLFRLK